MKAKFLLAFLLFLPISALSQSTPPKISLFYTFFTDGITFTFDPQFGDTLPLINSSGASTTSNNWLLKANVIDFKYVLQSELAKTPNSHPASLKQLLEKSFSLGVDYGIGPKSTGYSLSQQTSSLSSQLQGGTTFYAQIQVNGKDIRYALQKTKSTQDIQNEKDRAISNLLTDLEKRVQELEQQE